MDNPALTDERKRHTIGELIVFFERRIAQTNFSFLNDETAAAIQEERKVAGREED